jgi:hypothetical protein
MSDLVDFGPLVLRNLGRTQRFVPSKLRNSGHSVQQLLKESVSTLPGWAGVAHAEAFSA